jgi:tetratricopeptide (TPR) repeat protein
MKNAWVAIGLLVVIGMSAAWASERSSQPASTKANSQPATSQPAASQQAARPVVHIMAPSTKYAGRYDPMIGEAAARLAAEDLAARFGIYAQYWPADQQDKMPADAYPRVQVDRIDRHVPYLRMVRKGNEFTCYESADNKQFDEVSRTTVVMPNRVLIGLTIGALRRDTVSTAQVSEVMINGRPFQAEEFKDIRPWKEHNEISVKDGTWTLTTFGRQKPSDWGAGGFACRAVEGDFELQAKAGKFDIGAIYCGVGLFCRASMDDDSPFWLLLHNTTEHERALSCGTLAGTQYQAYMNDETIHDLGVRLDTKPGQSKTITPICTVTYGNWDAVASTVQTLADQIETAVADELQIDLSKPSPAKPATDEQLRILAQARKLMLEVQPGKSLQAARQIKQVLDESPTCAQAYYDAATCAAMPACADMYGMFHERGRFLAGPMAHWLMARRLGEPSRPEDFMAQAWVCLVSGYPNAALAAADKASPTESIRDELNALIMFAKRDYTLLTPDTVEKASPIQQVAWVFAVSECARGDYIGDGIIALAASARNPAMLPLNNENTVDFGHGATTLGITLGFARNAYDLLTCEDIPIDKRLTAGKAIAGAIGANVSDDPAQLARNIAWTMLNDGMPEEKLSKALAGLMDLNASAMELPAGPVVDENGVRLQVLPVHDLADAMQGLTIHTLYNRFVFMNNLWGVPDAASAFAESSSAGLDKVPGMRDCFHGLAMVTVDNPEEYLKAYRAFANTPAGRRPGSVARLSYFRPRKPTPAPLLIIQPGRGTWEWQMIAGAARFNGQPALRVSSGWHCLQVDDYSGPGMCVWMRTLDDPSVAAQLADRMPYDVNLLGAIACLWSNKDHYDKAEEIYRQLIALCPNSGSDYFSLARLYASQGNRQKAIETAKQAAEKCEFSVRMSNLMGELSGWLLEENKPEEALRWGQRASQSYSARGLLALANALEANHKTDKAMETFKNCAIRYDGCIGNMLDFMLRNNMPDDKIFSNMEEVCHGATVASGVVENIRMILLAYPERKNLIDRLAAGLHEWFPKEDMRVLNLSLAMASRDFDSAVKLLPDPKSSQASLDDLLWMDMIARFRHDDALLEILAKRLPGDSVQNVDITGVIMYVAGQSSADEMIKTLTNPRRQSLGYWFLGADAEIAGDRQKAIQYYTLAAQTNLKIPSCLFAKVWLKQMGVAASQPASAQAASQPASMPHASRPATAPAATSQAAGHNEF